MKFRMAAIAALALFLPFAAASCSSDGDKKVSAEEISDKLQDEDVPKDIADCMGKAFEKAGLTIDDTNLDEVTDLSKDKQAAVTEAMSSCTAGAVTVPE